MVKGGKSDVGDEGLGNHMGKFIRADNSSNQLVTKYWSRGVRAIKIPYLTLKKQIKYFYSEENTFNC